MHSPESTVILLVAEEGEPSLDLVRALERQCYRIHALAGLRAMDWLRREPLLPSLILIDWTMPRGDAARFLAQQASDPRTSAVPVVVVTDLAHMRSVPTLCVSATLAKPVRARTLLDVVGRLCNGTRTLAKGSSTQNQVVERPASWNPAPYPRQAVSSRSQEMTRPLPGPDDETSRHRCGDDRTEPTSRDED